MPHQFLSKNRKLIQKATPILEFQKKTKMEAVSWFLIGNSNENQKAESIFSLWAHDLHLKGGLRVGLKGGLRGA